MAQHQVITRMDTVATKLESAGAMRLAYMVDTVANTVSSGHDKNAGLLDLVKRPLAKALNAGVSKLLGNRKVQEAAAAIAKKVPVADLKAAFDNEELLSKVREFAARMGPSDLEEMLRSPEEYEHKLLAKIGLPGSKTAASGLSKGILMAMMVLTLMKTVHAGDMPTQVDAGHGGAHTTLDSAHGGDGHGGDTKAPGGKDTSGGSKYNMAIDSNMVEGSKTLSHAISGADALFEGKTDDITFTDTGVHDLVYKTIGEALQNPDIASAVKGLLKGEHNPKRVSPEARKFIAGSMHKVIMEKLHAEAGKSSYFVKGTKNFALDKISNKVAKSLSDWLNDDINIASVMGPAKGS